MNSTKSQSTNSTTTAWAATATVTFLPPAATATATFLPPTTTATTTANLVDLETSSDSDNSLKDCSKADFNSVAIDKLGNHTGMCGTPWLELNAKDAI